MFRSTLAIGLAVAIAVVASGPAFAGTFSTTLSGSPLTTDEGQTAGITLNVLLTPGHPSEFISGGSATLTSGDGDVAGPLAFPTGGTSSTVGTTFLYEDDGVFVATASGNVDSTAILTKVSTSFFNTTSQQTGTASSQQTGTAASISTVLTFNTGTSCEGVDLGFAGCLGTIRTTSNFFFTFSTVVFVTSSTVHFGTSSTVTFSTSSTNTFTSATFDSAAIAASVNIAIQNVDPVITSSPLDVLVTVGPPQNYIFAAGATDVGVLDVLTFDWDLDGDGMFDDATGMVVNKTFTGADEGNYMYGVRVRDGDGGEAFAYFDVTVIPEPASIVIWSLLGLVGFGVHWRRRRKAA